jgi:hypothetical protein
LFENEEREEEREKERKRERKRERERERESGCLWLSLKGERRKEEGNRSNEKVGQRAAGFLV